MLPTPPSGPVPAPVASPSPLVRMNNHAAGYAGLAGGTVGIGAIVVAVARLFSDLSRGPFILALWTEHATHAFGPATAELVGLGFGVLGACVVTALGGLAAYLSRPRTIA